jgi:hypothetical protein
VSPPGAPAPGGLHLPYLPHLSYRPHLPHLPHLPLARPRRRTAGVAVAAVGLIVAVTAGVALAGGLGGGGQDDARGNGFGATAPAAAPPQTAPTPSAPPPSAPATSAPPPGGDPSATDPAGQGGDPAAGDVYAGIRLPAGNSLVLQGDPPSVQPDASGGSFGFSADGQSFVAEAHHARLTVLDPHLAPTAQSCRAETGPRLTAIPRHALTPGRGRVCVHLVDGTLALVTLRQITPPAASLQYSVVDVTVWRVADQSAESDL